MRRRGLRCVLLAQMRGSFSSPAAPRGGSPLCGRTSSTRLCARRLVMARARGSARSSICFPACAGLGIDNLRIQIEGSELPAFDGSAANFVDAFDEAGIVELPQPRAAL